MTVRQAMADFTRAKRAMAFRLLVYGSAPWGDAYSALGALRMALNEGWRDYSAPARNGTRNRRMRRHERETFSLLPRLTHPTRL